MRFGSPPFAPRYVSQYLRSGARKTRSRVRLRYLREPHFATNSKRWSS